MDLSKFPFDKLEKEKLRLTSLRKYEPLISDSDVELDRIVKIASYICKTPISLVNLIEANHTVFKAATGTNLKGSPREISFCSVAIQENEILEIPDTLKDDRFKNNPLVTGPESIRFYAGAPLINNEGLSMGTLCLFDNKPNQLSEEQKEILDTLARHVVMHMELVKQKQTLQTANLSLVLKLQKNVSSLEKELETCKKLIPKSQLLQTGNKDLKADVKKGWIISCSIPELLSPENEVEPESIISFLQQCYVELNKIITYHAGYIFQYNPNGVEGYFIDPNAFPYYNKNALFCAFEILSQAEKLILPGNNLQLKNINIILHYGDLIYGQQSSEKLSIVLSGYSLNMINFIELNLPPDSKGVLVTEQGLSQIKDSVTIRKELKASNSFHKSFSVYEIEKISY